VNTTCWSHCRLSGERRPHAEIGDAEPFDQRLFDAHPQRADPGASMAKFVPVEPFDLVIFGGTGDLAMRKLLPALFHRDSDDQISVDSRIIAVSRGELSPEAFVNKVEAALHEFLPAGEFKDDVWARFSARLSYHAVDVTTESGWDALAQDVTEHQDRARVFYLATAPGLYGPIASRVAEHRMVHDGTRIVLEKPVGSDLASARDVNAAVGRVFREEQIYRIDHYLGKETVQNLMALRFSNSLFEPLWRRGTVDHVQITVAEDIGVGTRGEFYDRTGALVDMVQNHLLQLLCLVAMEPPDGLEQDQIRGEKLKVLRALRPIDAASVARDTVRGQYRRGAINGQAVPSYLEEADPASTTETFVALKVEIENWRWAHVPFYLRTGKRLATKTSHIVVQFSPVAHSIFPASAGTLEPNQLTIRLQPDEGVTLSLMTKEPGPGGFVLRSLPLNLSFSEQFPVRYPDAYERLLMEIIRGNQSLFMHREEVEAAWGWIDTIRDAWEAQKQGVVPYVAGTWGPTDSALMIGRDERRWFDHATE
jgi:glucose-6-phosphate 1-dehydrogenase